MVNWRKINYTHGPDPVGVLSEIAWLHQLSSILNRLDAAKLIRPCSSICRWHGKSSPSLSKFAPMLDAGRPSRIGLDSVGSPLMLVCEIAERLHYSELYCAVRGIH